MILIKLKPLAAAMGIASTIITTSATAAIESYDWTGNFTMLDGNGDALFNTSITTKGANAFITPVTGTMSFDDATGAGTATLVPFDFFAGTAPAQVSGFNMQAIGDGMGGPGSLVLGNMSINWSGNYGVPVSIVMDAAGFFGATSSMFGDGVLDQADVAGFGAVPASDGTYLNSTWGYLGIGPVPMATTEWNLTRANACGVGAGNCMGVNPSGFLPLVADYVVNSAEFVQGDGLGIGGVPMWDGPFTGFNANLDMLSLSSTGAVVGSIGPFPVTESGEVPVPAAAWLFGSGLLGLIGVAKRKKPEV